MTDDRYHCGEQINCLQVRCGTPQEKSACIRKSADCAKLKSEERRVQASVGSIIAAYLRDHGFDGLAGPEWCECGCGLGNLFPCENVGGACEPAYRKTVPCMDCERADPGIGNCAQRELDRGDTLYCPVPPPKP